MHEDVAMDALKHYHPSVGFCFFFLMMAISLASMHPLFLCMSFLAACGYGVSVSGAGGFLRSSWWLLILIAFVTLFNAFFGGQGLTALFRINLGFMQNTVTLEGLVYGLCMGLMLACVIVWFKVLSKVSTTRDYLDVFSRISPTAALMLARITAFVPELSQQAKTIERAQKVTVSSLSKKNQLAYVGALSSRLMEWGMEKSLITASSMMARGYGSRKRTSYNRRRFSLRDSISLGAVVILGLSSFVLVLVAGLQFSFYPYLSEMTGWWAFIPLALFCAVPLVLQTGEEVAWWRSI